MILTIWETLEKWSEDFKAYMISNDQSVYLYTGLFLLGILIFAIVFSALNKDN